MKERETTLLDYLYILARWKKFIILFPFLAGVVTAGITLLMPKWYTATATILIPQDVSGMDVSSLMTNFDLSFGGFFNLGEKDNRYHAILRSRGAHEHVIRKFDLQDYYQTQNLEQTIRALRSHVSSGTTDEDALYVSVEDRSPRLASDMANEYVGYLDARNKDLQTEQARNNRIFIQTRLDQNIKDLRAAEDSLNAFQETYDVISLPQQIEAALTAYTSLYSELQLKKVGYDLARINLSENNPQLTALKSELDAIQKSLAQYEITADSFRDAEFKPSLYVPFDEVPRIAMKYARLKRDIETHNRLFAFLTEQFEFAKLQEARNTPTLQILDRAVPPDRKSRPKRTLIVLFFAGAAFLFAVCTAVTFEYFRRIHDTSPEERKKIEAILHVLRKKRRNDE